MSEHPQLRPVEVHPSRNRAGAFDLFDPSGIAEGVLTLSGSAMFVASLMDGKRNRVDIQAEFMRRRGHLLFSDELDELIAAFDRAHMLAGPGFDAYVEALAKAYRAADSRPIRDMDAYGASAGKLHGLLDEMLATGPQRGANGANGRVLGLIAPHLDYARGAPCYAAAYGGLLRRTDAGRFVILGTNHFGQSPGVVGTRKDFDTPFGAVRHDGEFMRRIERRCGDALYTHEYDHAREHSIELQVILLKHIFKDRPITIAPYLCCDPCGPKGAACGDDGGIGIETFATALRSEIDADKTPTCIIAGADLSHVGRYFHDDRDLDADSLGAVEAHDRKALDQVIMGDPDSFLVCVRGTSNATNICSVGCIYVLSALLKDRAPARLLHYHQALFAEAENCVTCAAVEFAAR